MLLLTADILADVDISAGSRFDRQSYAGGGFAYCSTGETLLQNEHRKQIECSADTGGRFVALQLTDGVLSMSEVEVYPTGM